MQTIRSILAALFLFTVAGAQAETIAVIGTGSVGGALGPEFAAQGHTIVYGSRDPSRSDVAELVTRTVGGASATTQAEAVKDADIVVLAVPGLLVEEITKSLGDLSGKIIIDPTNPLKRSETGLEFGVDTSNGQIIQAAAPDAYVVKAFNTLNWKTMVDPEESGGPVSIPLVGDNAAAKATVAALVEGMGLEAIDLGGIENAHWVEGMLILWINNRYGSTRDSFDYHLRKVP
ncbi:MAG: NAD(P)-binding domain-containing protein [Gammaproteobacteria bacterium]|nr:NAD(P)-binding domain-containing protein [Gammaproteobacteria bacterium]MDH3751762.1 NAD(P)-binding domain-containing protein [Gammaproteobacteria bacterium]MDH3805269.1 NAD(P)-binding domain-containing protein [Gammaproteobacteria bacterium]